MPSSVKLLIFGSIYSGDLRILDLNIGTPTTTRLIVLSMMTSIKFEPTSVPSSIFAGLKIYKKFFIYFLAANE